MRKAARDFERDPESDSATTDDDYVVARIGHLIFEYFDSSPQVERG
jgi:hypothetical protein